MIPGITLYLTDNKVRIEIQETALSETIINHYRTSTGALKDFKQLNHKEIIIHLDEEHKQSFKLVKVKELFSLYAWEIAKGWRPIHCKIHFSKILKLIEET